MVELIAGGLIGIGGVIVGRYLPARRRTPKPPAPPKPTCGCGHDMSFHDPESGCHAEILSVLGLPRPCTCRRYTGPQPLPEFYAPEVTA